MSKYLNLLENVPVFAFRAKQVRLLKSPHAYYERCAQLVDGSTHHLYISSLYMGNDSLTAALVARIDARLQRSDTLRVRILIDGARGTRRERRDDASSTSAALLAPLVRRHGAQRVQVVLASHPYRRRSLWWRYALRHVLTPRWQELLGVHHIKAFVADSNVLISGANLQAAYFTTRADRYLALSDATELADYVRNVVDALSAQPYNEWIGDDGVARRASDDDGDEQWAARKLHHVLARAQHRHRLASVHASPPSSPSSKETILADDEHSPIDTWIGVGVQARAFAVTQEEEFSARFLRAPPPLRTTIASPYFNVAKRHEAHLDTSAGARFLCGARAASGFASARWPAQRIACMYAHVQRQHALRWPRVRVYQWCGARSSEQTFHVKGVWWHQRNGGDLGANAQYAVPLSLVGSSNLSERSVRRDTELQCALLTDNNRLQWELNEECARLMRDARPLVMGAEVRRVPLWVRAVALLASSIA